MSGYQPAPELGETFEHDGCAYTFHGDPRPHVTRDGRTVTLYAWTAACVDCGEAVHLRGFTRPVGHLKKRCPVCAEQARKDHLAKLIEGAKRVRAEKKAAKAQRAAKRKAKP